jgi:peptidase M24-like protein
LSASPRQTIVPNPGEGSRPVSISRVLSAELAVSVDGWVADSARTVVVGTAAEDDLRIIRATEEALEAAIEVARTRRFEQGPAGGGLTLRPCLTLALEPWFARTGPAEGRLGRPLWT